MANTIKRGYRRKASIEEWDSIKTKEIIKELNKIVSINPIPKKDIKEAIKMAEQYDNVERPKHYNREGGMESIEEMILVFGIEAVKNFCLCNVWKYRYRAADKNGEEDLKKSDWYMKKYNELCHSCPKRY